MSTENKLLFSLVDAANVNDIKSEDVDVPEWGVGLSIKIRNMSALQRGTFVQRSAALQEKKSDAATLDAAKDRQNKEIEILLVRLCACDAEFRPLFDETWDKWLGERDGNVIGRLADVALTLSGMKPDAVEKKSEPVPSEDSSSA